MKYINKQMAVLAATSAFIALTQIYDEKYHDHYTLGEYVDEFTLHFYSDDNSHLNGIIRKIKDYIQGAEITYDYLSDCKCYTAIINFKY